MLLLYGNVVYVSVDEWTVLQDRLGLTVCSSSLWRSFSERSGLVEAN